MQCSCGHTIDIVMGSSVKATGARILTAITVVVTAQCENCGIVFQVPIKSSGSMTKRSS